MKQLRARRGASHAGRSVSHGRKIVCTAERCGDNEEEGIEAVMLCPSNSEHVSRGVWKHKVFDGRSRGPLFFHTWTVVDRKSGFRGPLFFHTWTVVDREFKEN